MSEYLYLCNSIVSCALHLWGLFCLFAANNKDSKPIIYESY